MLGFKSFEAAQGTLIGIELMHMIRKDQVTGGGMATIRRKMGHIWSICVTTAKANDGMLP